jgi:hypothetical protein
METSYLIIILTGGAGIVGFLLRMFIDNINGILNNRKVKRTEHIEFLLSEFYMPIYILLHRENTIWYKIVEAIKNNENSEFITELDKENLNNHLEIQKIIMTNMAKASPQIEIAQQLIKYDEHVTIFKTLRKIGSNEFPIDYDSKYPTELYELIEKRIEELKKDKKLLLGLFGNIPITYKNITNCINKLCKKKSNSENNNDEVNNITPDISPTNSPSIKKKGNRICSSTGKFALNKNNTSNISIYTNYNTNTNASDIEANNYLDNTNHEVESSTIDIELTKIK